METKAWTRYLEAVTHPDNDRTVAEKLGISPSTISRWASGAVDPKPRQVVALARAYDKNPLTALIAAGYLDESDLGDELTITVAQDLEEVSTEQLVGALQERLEVIDQYLSWIEEIGGGRSSNAGLSVDVLRYIRPGVAPSEARGDVYVNALGDRLQGVEANGQRLYRPADNVGGARETSEPRQSDYDLVSHPYTEETGELMDE
ncbi:helix-turn-helix domain-containing protein [Leucobacter muris]|uniref:helix-turn-helix domain-containing protein n=1 Tax=Leucobacter muris TaxID=1935379 RepID=UPI0013E2EB7A|nr:helix-turn-helix transcriptional regulator [Leucobacter muris]